MEVGLVSGPEDPSAKRVVVVSHERSGTHFLMNALAVSFGLERDAHLMLDQATVNLNWYHPASVAFFFRENRAVEPTWLRKSHHQFAFFEPVIDEVLTHADIFCIHRDPRDVMHSYRHFLNALDWPEGPKCASAAAFIRAAPMGAMLRYQMEQLPDMLTRWRVHVEGWAKAAMVHPGIRLVRYEALNTDYNVEMDRIAAEMGWCRLSRERPEINARTVLTSAQNDSSNVYADTDIAFIRSRIGEAMHRFGYPI